jgi:D-alanyl-D-alanine carboxypeptidase/D-alanyl-D-alanine-endopeptidase (penicillin-binding protein 4)
MISVFVALLCTALLINSPAAAQPVELGDILDSPPASDAIWGIHVKSIADKQTLYARNERKLFIPASNMKLFTTAVALAKLGPEFTFTTRLYAGGYSRGSMLRGDLFVRGAGDPTISESFHGRATAVFEEWAGQLRRMGIREIKGDIVGDDNLFDEKELGAGWSWDDELTCYSARISALSFNDNCIRVTVLPGRNAGDRAIVRTEPLSGYPKITCTVTTVSDPGSVAINAHRDFGTHSIALSGQIPVASPPFRVRFSVGNPTLFAATVLKETLERSGIRVRGKARDIDDTGKKPAYAGMRLVASYRSPPLSVIIGHVNKRSQNLYAELLFRTLGSIYAAEGSTEKSAHVVKEWLSNVGILPDTLAIYDGSGLSRLNLVSPQHVTSLLEYMAGHPYFDYFYHSLPVAGVDGTLATRMQNTEAESRVRAKTGTLTHMVSLSGYLKDINDAWIAFSIMSNNCLRNPSEVRLLQDSICRRLFGAQVPQEQ